MNGCNALSSFKFFVQLCQALKHDRTLRIIMDTIKKGREKYGMKLKEAVDYAVDKKKQLIYNTGRYLQYFWLRYISVRRN